jgi:hypothetical protein
VRFQVGGVDDFHDADVIEGHGQPAVFVQQGDVGAGVALGNHLDVVEVDPGLGRLDHELAAGGVVADGRDEDDVGPQPGQVLGHVAGCAAARGANLGRVRHAGASPAVGLPFVSNRVAPMTRTCLVMWLLTNT